MPLVLGTAHMCICKHAPKTTTHSHKQQKSLWGWVVVLGASLLIVLFIYFAKCVTCEINRHHHRHQNKIQFVFPQHRNYLGKDQIL